MRITPREVLADISNGLEDGSARVYYARSDEDLFYVIGQNSGEWTARPIADERHEILLDLTSEGHLLNGAPITVTYRDGFKLGVLTLRPAA
jgi:hypothetical protein